MFLADCLALATYKSLHFLSLISICPKIYIHRRQDKTHIKIISMKLPFFILGFARILNIREKPLIRDECVHLNWWYSMWIFQKSLSNVYAFLETQEDYKNKLIWIAYLIGCNYVLSKAQLLKSFILWKYGNCPLSHVVNYKLQEELSRLELFTFFFLCLYGCSENRNELVWSCFWMTFLSSEDEPYFTDLKFLIFFILQMNLKMYQEENVVYFRNPKLCSYRSLYFMI